MKGGEGKVGILEDEKLHRRRNGWRVVCGSWKGGLEGGVWIIG